MSELERILRELGGELQWPQEPDVAGRVAARLGRRRRFPAPSWAIAVAAVGVSVGGAMAVPPARSAIVDLFRSGGVTVERAQTMPDLSAPRAAPGRPVTLAEARQAAPFPLTVPDGYRAVRLQKTFAGALVTFVWPDRWLSQFRGDRLLLQKRLPAGTRTEPVVVAGRPGLWIAGAAHELVVPGGGSRRAGNVLLWVRAGVTFRLEGDVTKERALRLARALAPMQP